MARQAAPSELDGSALSWGGLEPPPNEIPRGGGKAIYLIHVTSEEGKPLLGSSQGKKGQNSLMYSLPTRGTPPSPIVILRSKLNL
ncbi:hypothetical protein J6590_008789 [Homalodisca vitripennis]|nr:hypothetical protein J6590_008789 [Homalodisca vitripennis]